MSYVEQLEQENRRLRTDLREAKFVPATKWGGCRRGCSDAYLDQDGFCSPACHVGAPKGKFVTVAA